MSHVLTVTEVTNHFTEYINRVVYQGESFILMQDNKSIAELRPLPAEKRLAELPSLCASLPHLSDIDAAQFADDLVLAREAFISTEVNDPWES